MSMLLLRFLKASLFSLLAAAILGAPCRAWLYDGGEPTPSGPVVMEGSSTVWVCEPFALAQDSWVTSFGAAVGRGFGTPEMGFHIYLTEGLYPASTPVIASGTIIPSGVTCTYRYVDLSLPVLLDGGKVYYLTLVPNSQNFMGTVSWSYKQGAYYGLSTGDYGETWSRCVLPLSVRVDGYAVPEVDERLVLLLGSAGLAGLGTARRRFVSRVAADRA